MKTLVLVEHDGTSVKDATLAAVTAASKLGEVHLLVMLVYQKQHGNWILLARQAVKVA